jgi:hypothetical protein
MRRSQVIDELTTKLLNNTSLSKFEVRAAAELALDTMEELGMLPPIRLVEGNASCEWEPEND